MVNFEGASYGTLRNITKRSFCDDEVGGGSGGLNAIYNRPVVADCVISGTGVAPFRFYAWQTLGLLSSVGDCVICSQNLDTIVGCVVANFEVANSSSF